MKKCFKCGKNKSLSDFHKHSRMKDGHLNKCKDCTCMDVRKNRAKNADYYRAKDVERYRGTPGRREGIAERSRQWRADNPKKAAAHNAVSKAKAKGTLLERPCEICGSVTHIHAHHDDYSRPLDIRWLCPVHHKEWHDKNGEGQNG